MAEALFREAIKHREEWSVASAGVSAFPGNRVSQETCELLKTRGLELVNFRSQQTTAALLKNADAIFAMTSGHQMILEDEFPQFTDKIYLVTDFIDGSNQMCGCDIPDPIGMGKNAYEEVGEILHQSITGIIEFLDACAAKDQGEPQL
jgi:protein-tyrosine-phosphatase